MAGKGHVGVSGILKFGAAVKLIIGLILKSISFKVFYRYWTGLAKNGARVHTAYNFLKNSFARVH
jgi:hypothetical protein